MKRKHYFIILFFVGLFFVILYEKQIRVTYSIARDLGSGKMTKGFSEHLKNINKEIKPPAGSHRLSYYDKSGKFVSSYSDSSYSTEFLSKKELFTDPKKMQQDIDYKLMKMAWDMQNEKEEFRRTHDIFGKDKETYKKLIEDHKRMRENITKQNLEFLQEFKAERYEMNSDLR